MEIESLQSKMAMRAFHFAFQLSKNYDFQLKVLRFHLLEMQQ